MTSDDGFGYTLVARFSDTTYFVTSELNFDPTDKVIFPGIVQPKSAKLSDSVIAKLYTSHIRWITTENANYSMYFELQCGQTYTTTGTMNQRCSRYLLKGNSQNQKGVDTWSVWYSPKIDFGVSTRD
ncbi:uncharacterized protein LOC134196767 [Corticium candelabrum]|uniref:uncharacterized protein LOC134196767 n=1 Tax=Corticium candelabrum TaxID=121492 RepID=UPI002E2570BE|nr:uncharacterized protein LOC134196767 [Corticium candelabrum]